MHLRVSGRDIPIPSEKLGGLKISVQFWEIVTVTDLLAITFLPFEKIFVLLLTNLWWRVLVHKHDQDQKTSPKIGYQQYKISDLNLKVVNYSDYSDIKSQF